MLCDFTCFPLGLINVSHGDMLLYNYVIILRFRIGRLLSLPYEVSIDEIRQRVRTCVSEFRRLSHFLEYAGIFCSIIVFNIRVPGNLEN